MRAYRAPMRARLVWSLLLVAGCKKAADPPAAGSGSAVAITVIVLDAAVPIDAAVTIDATPEAPDEVVEPKTSDQGFGGLALGLTAKKVVAKLGEPESKDEIAEEGATGLWVSNWHWPKQGVELAMAAGKKDGAPTINSLTLTPPSVLKNPRGIGIGSRRDDVLKAFGKAVDKTASKGDEILIGSVYGGVFFDLKDQKVIKIFVGAGAE